MKYYLSACLLLISVSAHGALNKWVDADGKVHYSDEPPPDNVKANTLIAPPVSKDSPVAKTVAERDAEWRKSKKAKEEAAQKAAKQQDEALAKQKDCDALRANLTVLENGPRIVTYDAKGEKVYMDDDTRQKNIEAERKKISTYCN